MRQRKVTKEEQEQAKENYPDLYKYRMTTFAGFAFDFVDKNTFDDNEEEREKFYQSLWDEGMYPMSAFDFVAWGQFTNFSHRRFQILAGNIQGHAIRQESQ